MSENTTSFASLGVPAPIVRTLSAQGKTHAFPIQIDTLPDTLAGRDVLGRGRTGSGKTLAFAIPVVARLAELSRESRRSPSRSGGARPRALILAPTRELANQINEVIEPLATANALKTTTIYGGVNQKRQVDALRGGIDIVVACPGRLEDLLGQRFLTLDEVEISVLDEADHMADLGFLPAVTRILNQVPRDGQRLLFSATLDNGVDKLVRRFLHQPVMHSVDSANSPVAAMTHHILHVEAEQKQDVITTLASGAGRRILFMRTKHQAKRLAKKLTQAGIPAVDLHGNLSQPQRDRNLASFSSGDVKVLVATDVAARGVHVDSVELVVHVDPPAEHKAYLHRSGRTARAGSAGDVATLVLPEQRADTATLLRKAAIKATPVSVNATSREVLNLVGDRAPLVRPSAATAAVGGSPASGGARKGRNSRSNRSARSSEHPSSNSTQGSTQRSTRGSAAGNGASDRAGRGSSRHTAERGSEQNRSSRGRSNQNGSSQARPAHASSTSGGSGRAGSGRAGSGNASSHRNSSGQQPRGGSAPGSNQGRRPGRSRRSTSGAR